MLKRLIPIVVLLCALMLSACSPAATPAPGFESKGAPASGGSSSSDGYSTQPQLAPAAPAEAPRAAAGDVTNSAAQAGPDRVVIMNASLSIVVADPSVSLKTVTNMANEMGGFVVNSNLYKVNTSSGIETPEATVTIRVPAARLTEAMDRIKGLVANGGTDVLNENVSGQDVTKEYTDLQSQLTNLQAAQKRLENIMDQATKTEDVLAVYNQLTSVEGQIEVLKGQIKYYDESARLSSISVTMKSQEAVAPLTIGGWKPVGVARDALQTLVDVLKFLANAAIWLVIFCLPLGIVAGVPLFFIIRGFRAWQKKRKLARAAEAKAIE